MIMGKLKKHDLFTRVVKILDEARGNVVRAVNNNMVIAYWLIGREIVEEIQGGKGRAAYGKQVIEDLSQKLTRRYQSGFSETNLKYFRLFYQTYTDRVPEIRHIVCDESASTQIRHTPCDESEILKSMQLAVTPTKIPKGFSPKLSWSHYRALTQVENKNERLFYEIEAEQEGWSLTVLERQIHTFLFARLLKSRSKAGVMALIQKGQELKEPADMIKHPLILDFLGVNDQKGWRESHLESAVINHLQDFLLEMGKGFAFVKRQYRVETESSHFFVDLVFYNYLLKCFVLVDLKIGKLTHQDVGQMDMYVRMFDELERKPEDNPTVGLILCAEKDEIVVKYSMLKESRQIFASKYMLYFPSEAQLQKELSRDGYLTDKKDLPQKTGRKTKKK